MSVGRNRWSRSGGRWNSRPQTAVWAAVIIVGIRMILQASGKEELDKEQTRRNH
jgi:hypothetical protein